MNSFNIKNRLYLALGRKILTSLRNIELSIIPHTVNKASNSGFIKKSFAKVYINKLKALIFLIINKFKLQIQT